MRETWYVLEDGSAANPADVAPDDDGFLRHKDGRSVAMRGQTPRSVGVEVDERAATPPDKDLTPEPAKKTYKTREAKAGAQK